MIEILLILLTPLLTGFLYLMERCILIFMSLAKIKLYIASINMDYHIIKKTNFQT